MICGNGMSSKNPFSISLKRLIFIWFVLKDLMDIKNGYYDNQNNKVTIKAKFCFRKWFFVLIYSFINFL